MKFVAGEFAVEFFDDDSLLLEDGRQQATAFIKDNELRWDIVENISIERLEVVREIIMRYYNNRVFQ